MFAAQSNEFFRCRRIVDVLRNNKCLHSFAHVFVGHANNGNVGNLWVFNENFFRFGWVDVDSTRNNHVAETVGDVNKTIGGDVTNFSECENAWAQVSLGRFFGVIWVHHATAGGVFEKETTLGAGWQLIAIVIDNNATCEWRNDTTH